MAFRIYFPFPEAICTPVLTQGNELIMTSNKQHPDDSGDENVLTILFLFQTQFCPSRLTVCDTQTANISYGTMNIPVVIDDKGSGEDVVEQEGLTEIREVKEVLDQLETIRMEIQQAEGVMSKSPASGKYS